MTTAERLGALLLGLGCGLLLALLNPALASWWPLLFIVIGVMFWQGIGATVLRFVLVGLALTLMLSAPERSGLAFTAGTVVTSYRSVAADTQLWQEVQTVVIVNAAGNVVVEGGANGIALQVDYQRRRFGGGRIPSGLQTTYDERSQTLTVTGLEPESSMLQRGVSAAISVSVPQTVELRVSNQLGDLRVVNVASADVTSHSGELRLERVAGLVRARNNLGEIEVENSYGPLDIENNVGTIRISSDQPLNTMVDARTDVGDVILAIPRSSNVLVRASSQTRNFSGNLERVTANEGRLRLGSGQIEVDLRTRVGRIDLRLR